MNSKQFRIWLDGFLEAIGDKEATKEQWELLKKKMEEVPVEDSIQYYPCYPNIMYNPGVTYTPRSNNTPTYYTTDWTTLNN